jgi:hypothetical protein
MSRRNLRRSLVPLLALVALAVIAVPAIAGGGAPDRATQSIVGGPKFVPNRLIGDTMHFKKDEIDVRKGGKIVIKDRTKQDHTLSLVTKKQVPKNGRQVENCFSDTGPCLQLAIDHDALDPNTGEPKPVPGVPLVNKGKEGFNQPGDSIFIPGKSKRTIKVSGRKDMYYICAIHPWMQGKIDVPPLSR